MAIGTHVTLKSTRCSCPEFSFPLGDKTVSQPALSKDPRRTLSHCMQFTMSVVLSVTLYRATQGDFHPGAAADCWLGNQRHQGPFIVPLRPGDLPHSNCHNCVVWSFMKTPWNGDLFFKPWSFLKSHNHNFFQIVIIFEKPQSLFKSHDHFCKAVINFEMPSDAYKLYTRWASLLLKKS